MTTIGAPTAATMRPPGRGARRLSAIAVITIIAVGFATGRFVLFRPSTDGATSGSTRQAASPTKTLARLERDVARNPKDPDALGSLAAAYLTAAIQVEDTSYFGRAEALLDRVDVVAPDLDRTLTARGVLALSRHQFALALEYGLRVHARNPAQPDALAVLVDATVELGRYEEAGARSPGASRSTPRAPGVLARVVPARAPRR